MIIYNVTVVVDYEVVNDWLDWMKRVHIPEVMATGKFESYQILKVNGQSGDTGSSFAIQYRCANLETLNDYTLNHAPKLQQEHSARYGEKAIGFRTILEIMEDF
jgi:hypothetical protein